MYKFAEKAEINLNPHKAEEPALKGYKRLTYVPSGIFAMYIHVLGTAECRTCNHTWHMWLWVGWSCLEHLGLQKCSSQTWPKSDFCIITQAPKKVITHHVSLTIMSKFLYLQNTKFQVIGMLLYVVLTGNVQGIHNTQSNDVNK